MKTMKKSTFGNRVAACFALCFLLLGLSAFAPMNSVPDEGGIHFTIHLNNQLAVERSYGSKETPKTISLAGMPAKAEMVIRSSYCGQLGKKAAIAILDEKNQVLKEWTFDEGQARDGMVLQVQTLRSYTGKASHAPVRLFYFSKELPNGFQLLAIA